MLKENAGQFRLRLEKLGLSDSVITAAWPTWWSEAADASPSARAELRYTIARKLGLEPQSLIQDSEAPDFVWKETARYKHGSGESDLETWALTSFGTALGKILVQASNRSSLEPGRNALEIRSSILEKRPFVRFVDLISLAWALGVPIVHLRVFPLMQKRMAAMCVRVPRGTAILLGKDAVYPPQIAYYLAHELGHILLHHLKDGEVLVDLEPNEKEAVVKDTEESEADQFALELLTGHRDPSVIPVGIGSGPRSLAKAAIEASEEVRIEPGTLALSFGHTTGDWRTAIGALRYIYDSPKPVWIEVNSIAKNQLSFSELPNETAVYLSRVLGELE